MNAMTTFSERVVKIALEIPKGRVTTYGRIARAAGGGEGASRRSSRKAGARRREAGLKNFSAEKYFWPMASQSIIGILAKAWDQGEKRIPFHRIVYADGRIWINTKYRKERLALYKKEGIELDDKNRIKNFRDKLFEFK